jgi:nitroreductase
MRIPFIPTSRYTEEELLDRSSEFYRLMSGRRSIRMFSDESIPDAAIRLCVQTAGTAPSGANSQPWTFVIVKNKRIKTQIRLAAEKVEYSFYRERAPKDWKAALQILGTDYRKPFLEKAPYLIVIFVQKYGLSPNGGRIKHYYPQKSVGIATGFLLAALHRLGFSALTYTPSPMSFLNNILKRPENETPYLILVVGYAARDATVPEIERKSFEEICITM